MASGVTIERFDEVRGFLERAGSFLEAREAEHNLIFGICSALKNDPKAFGAELPVLVVASAAGRVVAAALRTPPWRLVLSRVEDPGAIGALAEHLAARDPELPGVNGAPDDALALASDFARRTGRRAAARMREGIYRLEQVVPPRPAPGAMRVADERDRALLAAWLHAFASEALPGEVQPDPDTLATRWLAAEGRTMYLWEDGGEVVSLTGAGGETPHGIRVGPVYTPPERRGRGYASNLVAKVSEVELDRGRRFVFLFTDLANPTSNAIYQRIGYERVSDLLVVEVVPSG